MTGGRDKTRGSGSVTPPLAVVLDMKNVAEIDYTVAAELHEFVGFVFCLFYRIIDIR